MHAVAKALNLIKTEVSAIFMERQDVIEAMLLAVLAKEHIFVLGPPGTGKSALTRELVHRFDGAQYFEQILSKTRPDAAVLGPIDVPLFREHGDFKRKINGFLPTANFAFLDEMGKMSPTLGHELLAVLNERILHQVNGTRSHIDVPIYTVFGAANEELCEQSEDASAAWDRMLVRVAVDYIKSPSNFRSMLLKRRNKGATRTVIPFAELAAAIDNDVPAIDISDDVLDMLDELKGKLQAAGLVRSDRRWEAAIKVLQASAFLAGRTEVDEEDIQALRFVLWDDSKEIQKVESLVLSIGSPVTSKCNELTHEVEALRSGVRSKRGRSLQDISAYALEVSDKLAEVRTELRSLQQLYPGQGQPRIDKVLELCDAVFAEAKNASLKQKF